MVEQVFLLCLRHTARRHPRCLVFLNFHSNQPLSRLNQEIEMSDRTFGISITHPTLYKKDSTGKTRYWFIIQDGADYWIEHGVLGGTPVTTEATTAVGKNIGRANETTPEKQADLEIKSLYKAQIDSGYHEDKTVVDSGQRTVAFFDPMLCDRYNEKVEKKLLKEKEFYSQPKLDGIRCIARANGLWSRNGKKIVSCPHIERQLKPLFERAPTLILDGELYNHDFKDDFNTITSMIKKEKLTDEEFDFNERNVEYHVYDAPSIEGGFEERYRALLPLAEKRDAYPSIILTRTDLVRAGDYGYHIDELMDEYYKEYVDSGYEGQIIRLKGAEYEEGRRSKNLIKRKPLYDSGEDRECEIVDLLEGKGNWKGKAKVAVLKWNDKETTKATIKGTMDYLSEVLKNKKKYIGTQATVIYQNLTPDGMPRFPVIKELNRKY
jgi:ATP-dependent DNA ligase